MTTEKPYKEEFTLGKLRWKTEKEYDIHCVNAREQKLSDIGSTHWSARTLDEAKRVMKKIDKEYSEKKEERDDEEERQRRFNEWIVEQMRSYLDVLRRELWDLTHTKNYNESDEERKLKREKVKRIRDDIKGILDGTKRVDYSSGYGRDTPYHYVSDVKKKEERK